MIYLEGAIYMSHILVVEDEKPMRELLRLNMLEAGYECSCAADGLQASELLENHTYDLAILDI
ncbi:MAG: response regulator, partial [Lachnospiraceae bacterium]|nr:response regulator [Lachnospiraceae bacterium]